MCKTKTVPKVANIKGTANKKACSPGRRMSRVGRAEVVANVGSKFNLRDRRRGDNMANRADSKAVARVRVKEKKAKLPQLPHPDN
jgi:hypothetical protein